jgi:hypothetical protein
MTDLDPIYVAEPRLAYIEALVEAVARRDGDVPWEQVNLLLAAFLGVRRDASVIAPQTGAVMSVAPSLRSQAVHALVGHRLRDRAASMERHRASTAYR